MGKCISTLVLFLISFNLVSQEYFMKQYRVEGGLPSDIVKASTQDSFGYFWIATDEGLVKYDGIKFTNYRNKFQSNFIKGFHTTQDGKLLVFSDLDFYQIINQEDTVIFKRLCPVDRTGNDSTLTYPKYIYEDSKGRTWISESQAVVNFKFNSFKRYDFDLNNRTPQFLRSFSFFEDLNGSLYVSSFQGNIFKYMEETDEFKLLETKFPFGVEHILKSDSLLLIGSSLGLHSSSLLTKGGFSKPDLVKNLPTVSFISSIDKYNFLIATRENHHYTFNLNGYQMNQVPFDIFNLNHVYISNEGDIWLSGNEGWILIRENVFQKINRPISDFIESITQDQFTKIIYYAISSSLYSYNPKKEINTTEMVLPSGYFQSIHSTKNGLWVANAFKVFLYNNGKILHEFDFSEEKRFVTGISEDEHGNIWLSVPGLDRAFMIDTLKKLKSFKIPLSENGVINNIKSNKEGIYIASSGTEKYLFYKGYSDTEFKNISVPVNTEIHGDFNVSDLAFTNEEIWLATSSGLFKFSDSSLIQHVLDDRYKNLPINSIYPFNNSKLLLGNAHGLIIYDTGSQTFELYNENVGLPSNTITPKGLFVSIDSTIWVGTANGICFNRNSLLKKTKTPTARFTNVISNGRKIRIHDFSQINFNSFLSLDVSSITFPEKEVYYKYRLLHENEWKFTTDNKINLTTHKSGNFTLEVMAKKNGPFLWSDVSLLNFTVQKPYWEKGWFFLIIICIVFGLVGGTSYGMSIYNKNKNTRLKKLIDIRTEELRFSNEKLLRLNNEKNNLIEIVAHDLKSPLHQINGLISIIKLTGNFDQETLEIMNKIESSSSRMNEMILKILDVNTIESEKLNLTLEKVNTSEVLKYVTDHFKILAEKKNIQILERIETDLYVNADLKFLEQVFENLISNAIKFSPFNKKVFISLISDKNEIVCEVKDEGPGMNEKDKENLFGKYQRLSAKPTGNEISTGLGLMIAKKFTDAMGGKIWCESEVGKGTSFLISFVRNKK